MDVILLDPSDEALVTIDWADVLPASVTLSSVTHTAPSPLVLVSQATDIAQGRSQAKVRGATHGALYMLEAQATLSNGEIINRQFPARGWNS